MSTIVVTGSSRGIGAAIAAELRARGATVLGHATRAIARQTIAPDLSDRQAPDILWVEALKRAGGRIGALVNNAGIFVASALDSPAADWLAKWKRTMQINLTAAAQLSRLAVRHWHSPVHWHYAAAKGGMLALHKTIARGYAGNKILSFAVAPGFVEATMAGDCLASRGGPGLLKDIPVGRVPLGRVATPEEIATMAAFCALDAPPSMTGATIDANGASHVR